MFIERLSNSQLEDFAKTLTSAFENTDPTSWKVVIDNHHPAKRLFIYLDEEPHYEVFIELYDIIAVPLIVDELDGEFIQRMFVKFMYRTFGDEYLNASSSEDGQ